MFILWLKLEVTFIPVTPKNFEVRKKIINFPKGLFDQELRIESQKKYFAPDLFVLIHILDFAKEFVTTISNHPTASLCKSSFINYPLIFRQSLN